MGASEWVYFVPYQVDIEQALQELRAQVFAEQGKDLQIYPSWWRELTLEEFLPPDPDLSTTAALILKHPNLLAISSGHVACFGIR